jgi:hypothetical protein
MVTLVRSKKVSIFLNHIRALHLAHNLDALSSQY